MAVSKKLLPRAVDRNRVKRLIRESARARALPPIQLLVRLAVRPTTIFSQSDRKCKCLLRSELDAGFAQLVALMAPLMAAQTAGTSSQAAPA